MVMVQTSLSCLLVNIQNSHCSSINNLLQTNSFKFIKTGNHSKRNSRAAAWEAVIGSKALKSDEITFPNSKIAKAPPTTNRPQSSYLSSLFRLHPFLFQNPVSDRVLEWRDPRNELKAVVRGSS